MIWEATACWAGWGWPIPSEASLTNYLEAAACAVTTDAPRFHLSEFARAARLAFGATSPHNLYDQEKWLRLGLSNLCIGAL